MSLAIVRNRIMKCQVRLSLYMALAVGLFSVSKTDYSDMINSRFVSFAEVSKEYIEEGKERLALEKPIITTRKSSYLL